MHERFKIRWAWFLPVLFVYRTGSVFGFPAYNFGFMVISDIASQESPSIPSHELVHSKQVIATLGLHCVLYFVSRRYRYWAERQAYRASIRSGLAVEVAAEIMAGDYGFHQTAQQIASDLRG